MAANNIRVLFDNRGKDLVIPIEQTWDFQGQQQAVEEYEAQVVAEILNKDQDFEVNRFVHKEYDPNKSSINYDFYFYTGTSYFFSGTSYFFSGDFFYVIFSPVCHSEYNSLFFLRPSRTQKQSSLRGEYAAPRTVFVCARSGEKETLVFINYYYTTLSTSLLGLCQNHTFVSK